MTKSIVISVLVLLAPLCFGVSAQAQSKAEQRALEKRLAKALKSSDMGVRRLAAVEAEESNPTTRKLISALIVGLADEDKGVQLACIRALAVTGKKAKRAKASLKSFGSHLNREIALEAGNALVLLGDKEAGNLIQEHVIEATGSEEREKLAKALSKRGPKSKGVEFFLLELLADESVLTRYASSEALRLIGVTSSALKPLRALLRDPDPAMASSAARTICGLGGKAASAIPTMISIMKTSASVQVRATMVRALGEIGPKSVKAVPAILKATAKDQETAKQGVYAIKSIGKKAVPILIKSMNDSNWRVRWMAARCLGEMPTDAGPAMSKLKDLAANDANRYVQDTADWALRALATPRYPGTPRGP